MPQPKKARVEPERPLKSYIQTTKGGTQFVRAIDVLRSEGGRRAIGAIVEDAGDNETVISNGNGNGTAGHAES